MKALLILAVSSSIGLPSAPASALPAVRGFSAPAWVEQAQLVCGPYRCFRRPFWRYGRGVGFRPYRRFGPLPFRRFGYRPFGFGRYGGFGGLRRY